MSEEIDYEGLSSDLDAAIESGDNQAVDWINENSDAYFDDDDE